MDEKTKNSLDELAKEPSGRLWLSLMLGMMLAHCGNEETSNEH